jgi:hypothetical protein
MAAVSTSTARNGPRDDGELTLTDVANRLAAFHHFGNALVTDREGLSVWVRAEKVGGQGVQIMERDSRAHRGGDGVEQRKIVAVASRGDHGTHQRFTGSTKSGLWYGPPFDM